MKIKMLCVSTLVLLAVGFSFALPTLSAQVPARLFDVRGGNGLTLDGTTYNRATVIVFKDNASKDAIIDAVCALRGYQATVDGQPNPQSKQAFFNAFLQQELKDYYREWKKRAAADAAGATAAASADAELP